MQNVEMHSFWSFSNEVCDEYTHSPQNDVDRNIQPF